MPRWLSPVLFVAGLGLLVLGWAMFETVPYGPSRGDRLGDVALWLACVALATALVWRGGCSSDASVRGEVGGVGSTALAGLAVALTPSVLELGGRDGDDGLAIAAAIALAAGLLRLWADRPRPRLWTWSATAAAAVGLVAIARPSATLGFDDAGAALRGTWEQLDHAFLAWIGREPNLIGGLPVPGVLGWSLALLALVLAAARLTTAGGRRVLWIAVPVAAVLSAFLYAGAVADEQGWFTYGAPPSFASFAPLAVLPLSLLALLAGDLVARSGAALWPLLAAGCFGLVGAIQVLALVSVIDAADVGGSAWIGPAVVGAATLAVAGAVGATGAAPARPPARPAKD